MSGREIVEHLIQERALRIGLSTTVSWFQDREADTHIARIEIGGGEREITFPREHIDDLPGHTRVTADGVTASPAGDDFFDDVRRRIFESADQLAKHTGRQIGF